MSSKRLDNDLHVLDYSLTKSEMILSIPSKLISDRSEQTVAIALHSLHYESFLQQLSLEHPIIRTAPVGVSRSRAQSTLRLLFPRGFGEGLL